MSEDAILLKLKREFAANEAVQILLKQVSELEFEVGVLKSERDEAIDRAAKVIVDGKAKKAWLKDEVIADLQDQMKRLMKGRTESRKEMEMWRNRYFSLLANKEQKVQVSDTTGDDSKQNAGNQIG